MPKFDIPKSWDPGYATPAYVNAEGLQMGTYTTRWAPRGTYDNPKPATLDRQYAIPAYVSAEGYGQGAKVTHWQPRGTFAGLGSTDAKARALGDRKLPAVYDRYGKRAARAIMVRLQAVSPANRKTELKKLLDAIDPTLWSRTDAVASKLVSSGVAPGKAFQVGLAQAMGAGIASELIDLGTSKTLPKAQSLLGLGCYGCAGVLVALGETVAPKAGGGFVSTVVANVAGALGAGTCTNPPQGFTWEAGSDETGGFWRRSMVNETPRPNPAGGCYTVDSRTGQPVQTQAPTTSAPIALLKVGPWLLRSKHEERISIPKTMLTKEQSTQLYSGIAKAMAGMLAKNMGGGAPAFRSGTNLKNIGWEVDLKVPLSIVGDFFPVAKFTHPETQKTCAIYVKLIGTVAAPQVQVMWGEVKSLWAQLIGFLVDLIAAIVKPILEELGDLACELAGEHPGATDATANYGAAAGPYGAAAAAGASMAQKMCGGAPAPAEDKFPLLPVAIAGGAVLALAAFWPKKKRTP